ncbi:MAG: TolC family outer membrane protein [Magnetococcales bacterium]|nr:TolC family outer membrane protein [Magnetococcales bacterium]
MRGSSGIIALLMLPLVALLHPEAAHSETLVDAVTTAVRTNPEARAAAENRAAVEQTIRQSRAGYLPTVDASGAYGPEWSDNSTTRAASEGSRTMKHGASSLTASQMLFDGGAVASQVDRAKAAFESARSGYDRTAETVAQTAMETFLDTMKQRELEGLLQQKVALHQETLEKIRAKFQSGAGNEADVQQTETRLALASSEFLTTQGMRLAAEARYLRLMGHAAPTELTGPEVAYDQLPKSLPQAVEEAQASHPAIIAAQFDLTAAQADLAGTKAAFLPTLKLEVNYANNANQSGSRGYGKSAYALLKSDYNLFRGGSDQARKAEVLKRADQMTEVLEQMRRTIRETVETAWESHRISREKLVFLERQVEISTKVLAAYEKQFEIGKRTLLDLLNTKTELTAGKVALTTERYNLQTSALRLMATMGQLRRFLGITE